MTEPSQFQEYPKMLYRLCDASETKDVIEVEGRKVKYRIVGSADEQRQAKGWSQSPAEAVKRKRLRHCMQTAVRPWWEKWEWALKLLAAILVIVAAAAKILEAFPASTDHSNVPPSANLASAAHP